MRVLTLSLLLVVSIAAIALAEEHWNITLDHVVGAFGSDSIPAGVPITFNIRFDSECLDLAGLTAGWQLYGQDSSGTYDPAMTWEPFTWDSLDFCWECYDLASEFHELSNDGTGRDTLAFVGGDMLDGDPGNWDVIAVTITTTIPPEHIGQQFCIDSSGYNIWDFQVTPCEPLTWDGPHCFEIVPCCRGMMGNVNLDPDDQLDIADLVFLVGYMFLGNPTELPCLDEVDTSQSGHVDIVDLIDIISYMFHNGPPLPQCH